MFDEAVCREAREFLGILYRGSFEVEFCKYRSASNCRHFRKPTWASRRVIQRLRVQALFTPTCSSVSWADTSGNDVRRMANKIYHPTCLHWLLPGGTRCLVHFLLHNSGLQTSSGLVPETKTLGSNSYGSIRARISRGFRKEVEEAMH